MRDRGRPLVHQGREPAGVGGGLGPIVLRRIPEFRLEPATEMEAMGTIVP
jgi:hypothetical protein